MRTFFTSDTHFGHANIILYSKRPQLQEGDFTLVDGREKWVSDTIKHQRAREMDATLILNWNSRVTNSDIVYHLGDFHFGRTDKLIEILRKLNFKTLYLIWGNHDTSMKDLKTIIHLYPELKGRIIFLGNMEEVIVEGQLITLCHYACRVWNKSHRSAWHLYGHSHGSLPEDPNSKSFDVGVDCFHQFPVSFAEVKNIMDGKTFKPVDHHSGTRTESGSEFEMRK